MKRVILCLRYGIGDLVLESSLFPDLREHFSGARLTFVGARPAVGLVAELSWVDEVVAYQDLGVAHWGDPGDPASRTRIRWWLEEDAPDLVLDPDVAPPALRREIRRAGVPSRRCDRSAIHAALAAGKGAATAIRIGAARGWDLPLSPHGRPALPARDRGTSASRSFRVPGPPAPVAVAPLGGSPLKRWPVERFARLCRRILDDGAGPVLVIAGPDGGGAEDLTAILDDPRAVAAPRLSLNEVAAAMERCRLLVCNDTGLMHLASALGVPTVGVFGPSSAAVYGPRGTDDRAVATDVPCVLRFDDVLMPPECVLSGRCLLGLRSCIDAVSVDEVHRAVRAAPAYRTDGSAALAVERSEA